MPGLRVLVITVVHHPDDSRIRYRQITALLTAGWQVTYAAPWAGYGLDRPHGVGRFTTHNLPRATRRRRYVALRSARRLLLEQGPLHDVVLLHDPELLFSTIGLDLPPVVWDVHEDTAAAIEVKDWIPRPLRRLVAVAARRLERVAERRVSLLLADYHYANRFRASHVVIPNSTTTPSRPQIAATREASVLRVVYLGSITMERGADEMVRIAQLLPADIRLEIIGSAHGPAQDLMRSARDEGLLDWRGFVPAEDALRRLDGALAGLCLLHDKPNFRPSMATKVLDYLGRGVPAVVTPLPVQDELIKRSGAGEVVPFGSTHEVVDVLRRWASNPQVARDLGARGHQYVVENHDWRKLESTFVDALEEAAAGGR